MWPMVSTPRSLPKGTVVAATAVLTFRGLGLAGWLAVLLAVTAATSDVDTV